jgi:hypothetical protein
MADLEGMAWSRQVFGEVGPHVRSVLPRVLVTTHSRFAAMQTALNLGSAAPYGLMWLGVPRALVEELNGLAGVQIYHPRRASYRLLVINGVPLIPWRYAKDRTTNVKEVLFGKPVSETRKSVFQPLDLQSELPLGEEGLGDAVVAELTPEQRQELDAYGEDIRKLSATHRAVAVLAYASNPDALHHCYFGYAELGPDNLLDWKYREKLELSSVGFPAQRSVVSVDTQPAFDAGPVEKPILRPRSPLAGEPTSEPTPTPEETGADE